jgi:isopentenyl-diphosphate delta-isomerase
VLKAHKAGGYEGAKQLLSRVIMTVRSVMLLTGCRTVAELRRAPRHLGQTLARWSPAGLAGGE